MSFHLREIQEAVYGTLNDDSALSALVSGVYDAVPDGVAFPYVHIGNIRVEDVSSTSSDGVQADYQLDIYSRYFGRSEVLNIMARIHTLLHDVSYSISGIDAVHSFALRSDITTLSDGRTMRGAMVFRIDGRDARASVATGMARLKIGDGASPVESFTDLGGVRIASLLIDQSLVAAQDLADSAWQQIHSQSGVRRLRLEIDAAVSGSASELALQTQALAGTVTHYQLVLPESGGTISGAFMVQRYMKQSGIGRIQTMEFSLESAGDISLS